MNDLERLLNDIIDAVAEETWASIDGNVDGLLEAEEAIKRVLEKYEITKKS